MSLLIPLFLAWLGAQRYTPPAADIEPLPMRASCSAEANAEVDRGAAFLVVLANESARQAFERAAVADPDCALGYWGQAASRLPSANDTLIAASLTAGADASRRAASVPARTPHERALVESIVALFAPPSPTPVGVRLDAYERRLRDLAAANRDSDVLTILHARAMLLRTTLPGDTARLRARAAIESAYAGRPLSPGAAVALLESWEGTPAPEVAQRAADAVSRVRAPQPQHLALRALVDAGLWDRAVKAGEQVFANVDSFVSPDTLYGAAHDYAGERLIEADVQRGDEATARGRLRQMVDALAKTDLDEHDRRVLGNAVARAGTRLGLDRRSDLQDRTRVVDAHWTALFLSGLSTAWSAWPGGDKDRLRQVGATLAAIDDARGEPEPERALARALIDAAASASQDEHAQTTLLLTHAQSLERELMESGRISRPLQPAQELAAEIWQRFYRYPDAEREGRAAQARFPNRWRTLLTLARSTAAQGRVDEARAFYRQIEAQRTKSAPDDFVLEEVRRELR